MPPIAPTKRERSALEALVLACVIVGLLASVVFVLTHVVAPRVLTHYEYFPALSTAPRATSVRKGDAADPLNVALVGSAAEIAHAFHGAGWTLAEPLSHANDVAIAKSVLLNRPDSAAPVSDLFLFGRKQDLAYELEVGPSARRRHHVRLWLDSAISYQGRPVWLAGATFDASAGVSHRTLGPTHHIAPDIDQERDALEEALAHNGQVAATFRVTGLGVRVRSHTANGDRFDTDGELRTIVISPGNVPHAQPVDPGVPYVVAVKDRLWAWGHRLLR
jgi:hypothetical protein